MTMPTSDWQRPDPADAPPRPAPGTGYGSGYPQPAGPDAQWVIPPPVFPGDEPGQRPRALVEAGVGLAVAVTVAVLGFPLGALWSAIAPHTPAVMTSDGAFLADPEAEHRIADEGWYLILAIAAGVLVATLAWVLLRRYRGVAVLAGLAVGGAVGGVLAWWFGHNIGLAHAKALTQHAPVGTHFGLPVNLRVMNVGLWHGWLPYATGDVLAIGITAALLYVLLSGFSAYPSLVPPRAG